MYKIFYQFRTATVVARVLTAIVVAATVSVMSLTLPGAGTEVTGAGVGWQTVAFAGGARECTRTFSLWLTLGKEEQKVKSPGRLYVHIEDDAGRELGYTRYEADGGVLVDICFPEDRDRCVITYRVTGKLVKTKKGRLDTCRQAKPFLVKLELKTYVLSLFTPDAARQLWRDPERGSVLGHLILAQRAGSSHTVRLRVRALSRHTGVREGAIYRDVLQALVAAGCGYAAMGATAAGQHRPYVRALLEHAHLIEVERARARLAERVGTPAAACILRLPARFAALPPSRDRASWLALARAVSEQRACDFSPAALRTAALRIRDYRDRWTGLEDERVLGARVTRWGGYIVSLAERLMGRR
ncbi:MAG: hypothetical protein Tsb0020_16960 [Haliangiales bacterium]